MRSFACLAPIFVTVWLFIVSPNLQAQARVFVSGSGNDLNACSVTSPCRTFQKAHNVVAENGEIVVLNSAGYGAVVVTKSVSIKAPDGLYAGVSSSTEHGVHIIGDTLRVYLRGLTIVGNQVPDSVGVYLDPGARVVLDRCQISRFDAAISIAPSNQNVAPILIVKDTLLSENEWSALVSLNSNCSVTLLRCTVTGGTRGLVNYGGRWTIQDTLVEGVTTYGILGTSGAVLVSGSTFMANGTGVNAGAGTIRLVGTKVTGNGEGLVTSDTGRIESGGQNIVIENESNGTFSGTFTPQ